MDSPRGEAYDPDSDSDASSGRLTPDSQRGRTSGPSAGAQPQRNAHANEDDEAGSDSGEDSMADPVEVDWDKIIPQLRRNVMSRSKKRREKFFQDYLKISDNDPPAQHIPAIVTILLSCLSLLDSISHVELLVGVLLHLAKRDQDLPEGRDTKLKLGEKLAKWTSVEVGKLSPTQSAVPIALLPYVSLLTGLLQTLTIPEESRSRSIMDLAIVMDAIESQMDCQKPTNQDKKVSKHARRLVGRLCRLTPLILDNILKSTADPPRLIALLGIIIDEVLSTAPAEVEQRKDAIVAFYSTHVLGSKTVVPRYRAVALSSFLSKHVDLSTLTEKLLPTAERMLLRSPEIALPTTAALLRSTCLDISSLLPAKLLPAVLSASKSSNADTRLKAIDLFYAICNHCQDDAKLEKVVMEVMTLPKTGKTGSPEHRVALFNMIHSVKPSEKVSIVVLETVVPLLAKETNEPALQATCQAIEPHLAIILSSEMKGLDATITMLAKELNSSRLPTKRAVSDCVGKAILSATAKDRHLSSSGQQLVGILAAALDANLESAASNPPTNVAGYLEGYVAIALAFGALSGIETAKKLSQSSGLANALTLSPKPSFLLNDKIWIKLPSSLDSSWLLKALMSIVETKGPALKADVSSVIGQALVYLLLDHKESSVRREALRAIESCTRTQPLALGKILANALQARIYTHHASFSSIRIISDEEPSSTLFSRRIGKVLDAIFSSPLAGDDRSIRDELALRYLTLAHHVVITENAQTSWISLVQKIGVDPAVLVVDRSDEILEQIWSALSVPVKDTGIAQAAFRSLTTLVFLCPAIYIDVIMARIRFDLDESSLEFIGLEERGIWATPPDQVFVDVLSSKKDVAENKNRKDYATDKWEQEVRDALARKKTLVGANLSKADKAAVTAQMNKEAEVRTQILLAQGRLREGVQLVSSLAASNSEGMKRYVGEMLKLLIRSVYGPGNFLMDEQVFSVVLQLGAMASDRLGEYRRLLVGAILRAYGVPLIPEDYLHEDLADLIIRLMHQTRFLSEQSPLDSTTFGLCSILFAKIVDSGGCGTQSVQSDEAQEQLTLVVNIIGTCCGEFADNSYPRLDTIKQLVQIINTYPKLGRDASASLVDLGDAIREVATEAEIKALIAGTLSKDSNVRNAALQALQPVDLTDLDYSEELYIAAHDSDEQNANLAAHLWEDNGLDIPETYLASLLGYLAHETAAVRMSCATAIADAAEQHPSQLEPSVQRLQELYSDKARLLQPEYDRFGMVIPETVNRADPWEARVAIATALRNLAPMIPQNLVASLFDFFISGEALGDRHSEVRKTMLEAAISTVDLHGAKEITSLMKMFEEHLGKSNPSTDTGDNIKEAVVILFGRLAGHLDANDSRIPQVVDRLVEALNTPSESVQAAVADCLPALVSGMGEDVEFLVDKLFSTLTTGPKYAGRRGAAYGLAGVVKGRGLSVLKEFDLMDKLKEAAEDKSAYQLRQGAAFAFETLSATLGKTFEPYIISIIPLMLTLFGDGNSDVREATQDAAKVIMSRISGHCVKLMLPTLLGGLEEKQWRTKKGSIELLGSMAFCAPRQLSLSLPTIIPQLTSVINDSHAQVKSAANASLKRFGEVLSNPEIKSILNTLMKALADPAAKTNSALSSLLKTSFEHYLDAPSLAMVMPIVDRGLRQRSSDTKRRAVQIVGNMASLTESRDLIPYLDELMPLVHEVLVDPVPEARATAAKSLGTLIERLGEPNFPNLVSRLLQMLKTDTSGVDRQGAAQGLSEVLSGLGMERLEALLPEIISSTSSPRPYVREGFISLLVYLPATFGHRFAPHLGRVIPPILNGLADDSEYVREASMRAGKMIIANYSSKAIDLLLPELEKGMLDPSWRIRQPSIALTGELLYKVTGISGKVELEEDEVPAQGADNARMALSESLGPERRDRVLATLYIVRQDSVANVRQASIHIWKSLVQNTPRTTREILPVLMQLLMTLLGSPEPEQQETASRTLGELCRKNGERIFGEIMPILQKAITSSEDRTKEGACLAFADVMAASNKDVLADHEDAIISAVRIALVDPSSDVRAAAARTFDTMQHYLGAKAIDQTIPTLLAAMRDPGETSETALKALKEVMSVRANSVFPVLVPTLIAQPISAFNARALGALVQVAGTALNRRLDSVLGALVESLEAGPSEDTRKDLDFAVESLLASVTDSDGIHLLEMLLLGWVRDAKAIRRASGCKLLATMCAVNSSDTSDYRVDWIRNLVSLFDDKNDDVVTAAWEGLEAFVKTVDKDELEDLVVPLRRTIESLGPKEHKVPGFSRSKGVQSIVPILLAGVLSGTQEQREQAALGIGDLVQRTTEAAIKPYIIQLTGPLIRVISSQSIPPQIKAGILIALTILLEEVPQLVRPFHPQLTRTFVKSTSDPSLNVRNRAATGLGELMKHQTRVDPLITELITGIKASEKDVAASMVAALGAVCQSAGKNLGEAARASIVDLIEDGFLQSPSETYSMAIGKVVAGLAATNAEHIRSIVDTFLAAPTPPTPQVSIAIRSVLEDCPEAFFTLDVVSEIVSKVSASIASDSAAVARPGRDARDIMKGNKRYAADSDVQAAFK
ncbi:regulation of translational elongation-related protein [Kockovaella imperatae]|uniref:Regulation of translational elongation-related protein n=1 Tax=Kockovaella imperatae TaxID=4999 RepID=A0A1Y1UQU2_9TREE|nr:regulation of translational elongation-related protein [Kockovaella imperatae]ORX39844.1 regulation of translational elongation-related protein [Kockovaella imperatae]